MLIPLPFRYLPPVTISCISNISIPSDKKYTVDYSADQPPLSQIATGTNPYQAVFTKHAGDAARTIRFSPTNSYNEFIKTYHSRVGRFSARRSPSMSLPLYWTSQTAADGTIINNVQRLTETRMEYSLHSLLYSSQRRVRVQKISIQPCVSQNKNIVQKAFYRSSPSFFYNSFQTSPQFSTIM